MNEDLFSSAHITLILTFFGLMLVPFCLFWLDTRRQNQKHHQEWMDQQQKQHMENLQRFATIETSLAPIVAWWNRERSSDHD